METFQKIYRPEIYNADVVAPATYRPTLEHTDFAVPPVTYDREERSRLGVTQGRWTEESTWSSHTANPGTSRRRHRRPDPLNDWNPARMSTLLPTAIVGSLPKPSWLAEPERLWSPWQLEGDALTEGKQDALRSAVHEQERRGIGHRQRR